MQVWTPPPSAAAHHCDKRWPNDIVLALIAELPGSVEWVDIAPEDLQQARIVYFSGILDYFDCFSVSRAAR